MTANRSKKSPPESPTGGRPVIFGYHDYRLFLRDWFTYLRHEDKSFTLRAVARKAGLSCAYLPLVLAGARNLSQKALELLGPQLSLDAEERVYLGLLRILSDSESEPARRDALNQIQRFQGYQRFSPKEFAVYRYLERWYLVAIREMAALADFKADPKWISERLKGQVPLAEIKLALQFLSENGYLEIRPDGSAKLIERNLECVDSVFRIALRGFHRQMFEVAAEEFGGNNPPEQRYVMGHTMAFPSSRLDELKQIIGEAISRIEELARTAKDSDTIYHTGFFAIPLAKKDT